MEEIEQEESRELNSNIRKYLMILRYNYSEK